ncbi:subtilisin-like protease SBT4.3 [Tanacetum coccineum]
MICRFLAVSLRVALLGLRFVSVTECPPGIEILAAFSPLALPSASFYDKRFVKYNILSGTSVSCPHVMAAAAYVKSFHPEWSPSAIKSALMTTARTMDPTHNSYAEFAYGSGHIDPVKAIDPGLVYDTSMDDYHKIWCHISNSTANFTLLNGTCTPVKLKVTEINYPSMAAHVKLQSIFAVSFLRTVNNVGRANATYVSSVTKGSSKLQYTVQPKRLHFTSHNQKMSFVVTVKGKIESQLTIESASLLWRDESHNVRSPVVVYTGTSTSRGEGASTPPRFFVAFVILLLVVFLY